MPVEVSAVDPFDLPEWLGVSPVTWTGESSIDGRSHLVCGSLETDEQRLTCDVLACDLAFPQPVLPERWRREAHSSWMRDEVLLLERDGRLAMCAPGSAVGAELVLEAVRRLAKAVGASPERFTVALRL
jgi:hypothetical protein